MSEDIDLYGIPREFEARLEAVVREAVPLPNSDARKIIRARVRAVGAPRGKQTEWGAICWAQVVWLRRLERRRAAERAA